MNSISENINIAYEIFKNICNIPRIEFEKSTHFWQIEEYDKGQLFNNKGDICKKLSIVLEGSFRGYKISNSGDEYNFFLYSPNQVLVAFKSFVEQSPCEYYTEAISKSTILSIPEIKLNELYKTSHAWENFGRKLAEYAFVILDDRLTAFTINSPEERYLTLIAERPSIFNQIPLKYISSYLGIQPQSLSRIKKRLNEK